MATAAGFVVDNFDEVVERLRSKGVAFEEVDFGDLGSTLEGVVETPDASMKVAWFKDSEGNIHGSPPGADPGTETRPQASKCRCIAFCLFMAVAWPALAEVGDLR